MMEEGLSIDEVDALTGPVIGRPKSATFRLGDMVGVDLMVQMGRNLREMLKYDPLIGDVPAGGVCRGNGQARAGGARRRVRDSISG